MNKGCNQKSHNNHPFNAPDMLSPTAFFNFFLMKNLISTVTVPLGQRARNFSCTPKNNRNKELKNSQWPRKKCTRQPALNAVRNAKSPSSLIQPDQSTAANAGQKSAHHEDDTKQVTLTFNKFHQSTFSFYISKLLYAPPNKT